MDIITTSTISHLNDLVINGLIPIFVEYINNQYHIDITEKELEVVLQNSKYTKTNVDVTNYNKKCIWEFNRGKSKGDLCGKPTVGKTNYCSACIKRSVLKPKQNASVKTESFFDELPTTNTTTEGYKLEMRVFDEELGLYKDCYHNFIFKRENEDSFKLIGKSDYTHDKMVLQLTHEDVLKAKALNFPMDDTLLQDI